MTASLVLGVAVGATSCLCGCPDVEDPTGSWFVWAPVHPEIDQAVLEFGEETVTVSGETEDGEAWVVTYEIVDRLD